MGAEPASALRDISAHILRAVVIADNDDLISSDIPPHVLSMIDKLTRF